MIAQGKKIILFDGVCNLCNTWVQRIIEKDANDIFRFASLQSDVAKQLMNERHLQQTSVDSIVLIVPGVAYFVKSDAALEIAKEMGGKYRLLQMILSVFPVSLRDRGYDFIAKNRYKWYGKMDSCMVPTTEVMSKFLG